jgi:glycosyltransferase involved in cell wall biosynthesis
VTAPAAGAAGQAPPLVSRTHLVLIPSYNAGALAARTVLAARAHWAPVWIVVDGSTDGSLRELGQLASADAAIRVLALPRNCGKGAALLFGARAARDAGYTHALTMDSDAQHPPQCIAQFMEISRAHPQALILGRPQFDASAPALRVRGRKICNWWVNLETLWAGIGDSLFGFRVYPLDPLIAIMDRQRWMRRFDFDAESAVRLCWRGVPLINVTAPVRYLRADEGGVSHFNYLRDNALLSWMHARLAAQAPMHWPALLWRRRGRHHRL